MTILKTKKVTINKEIDMPVRLEKTVKRMGRGGYIYLPACLVGQRVIVVLESERCKDEERD